MGQSLNRQLADQALSQLWQDVVALIERIRTKFPLEMPGSVQAVGFVNGKKTLFRLLIRSRLEPPNILCCSLPEETSEEAIRSIPESKMTPLPLVTEEIGVDFMSNTEIACLATCLDALERNAYGAWLAKVLLVR